MLLVHHADHFFAPYLQCCAVGNGRGCGQTQPHCSCERFFTHKVAIREKRDCGFLSGLRDDSEFCTPGLEIEDRIGRVPLRKTSLSEYQVDYSSPRPALARNSAALNVGFSRSTIEVSPFRSRSSHGALLGV